MAKLRGFARGEDGYETARLAAVWNGRAPHRYPDQIVKAADDQDLIAAVRLAGERGWKVGVRSGGHSWAANHVRDGGLLLDVSQLNSVVVDAEAMTAVVGPGVRGNELLETLAADGLFFPAGHCPGVALGGYLLQGGFGWNSRVHGPACMSVEAIDVVTADGELVCANESNNSDLLWAARGAGPGFFGVVARFHLRLHPAPRHVANGFFLYPIEAMEEVFSWAQEIGPRVAREMEMMIFIHRDAGGEPEIAVTGPVLAQSAEQAAEALVLLESCPVLDRAKAAAPNVEVRLADLYAAAHESYPDGWRYAVDNMWTHAPVEDLMPGLRRITETMPEVPSHMLWMNWGPSPERPEMAYSVEDDTYIALYGVWQNAADDAANVPWAAERMAETAHLASGIQLADENLAERPARFANDKNMARLDRLRAQYDPDGLFHPWMGRL
ncbi:MAG TPA: FAD-binding oxidoreductase [Solirubrobacterales bacterium]|jgi:FAD/FMN-containing dehydrogenase|nr:FAD-binding oxidoreductase [Solirubrobacterales bacterium]